MNKSEDQCCPSLGDLLRDTLITDRDYVSRVSLSVIGEILRRNMKTKEQENTAGFKPMAP